MANSINKIQKIKNHRIFIDWKWKNDLPEFSTYNLIYGWNGSGKTTLTNLFRAIEKKQNISEGEVVFSINNVSISGINMSTDHMLPQVRVFNSDFIKENMFTTKDVLAPIFFLGEEKIEK